MAFWSRNRQDPDLLPPVNVAVRCVGMRPEDPEVAWTDLGEAATGLQEELDARVERLPLQRLRKWSDLNELVAVESDHVARLARRYALSDRDHHVLQRLWFARIDPELEEVTEHLRRILFARDERIHQRCDRLAKYRLGKHHLGQLYWNTFGPGGETWFGDHLPVRRFLFRLHWRP
jgi:hypothetical protein